jgi:hypothetical protein
MRGFVLGFLLCLSGSAAVFALDIQIQQVSIRDLFAGSAMAGILANSPGSLPNPDTAAGLSWQYANALMRKR